MEEQPDSPENQVMCHCSGTKRGYIRSLFEQGMDIHAISRWTGALSGCGGCEWDIGDFLKELAAQQESETNQNK
jgi:NAD(P)H-nitrite reductase large subunit